MSTNSLPEESHGLLVARKREREQTCRTSTHEWIRIFLLCSKWNLIVSHQNKNKDGMMTTTFLKILATKRKNPVSWYWSRPVVKEHLLESPVQNGVVFNRYLFNSFEKIVLFVWLKYFYIPLVEYYFSLLICLDILEETVVVKLPKVVEVMFEKNS